MILRARSTKLKGSNNNNVFKKHVTKVIRKNLNPVWNENVTWVFGDPVHSLEFEVKDRDKFGNSDAIGEYNMGKHLSLSFSFSVRLSLSLCLCACVAMHDRSIRVY